MVYEWFRMRNNDSVYSNLNKTFEGAEYSNMTSSVPKRMTMAKSRNSRNISMMEQSNKVLLYNITEGADIFGSNDNISANKTMIIEDRINSINGIFS
jgi:hypothetical protein